MPLLDTVEQRRFWEKVAFVGASEDQCWEWRAARNPSGHGRFGRSRPAHRIAYEELVGPIPAGLHLDHLCRHPWCVNPRHLEPVTLWENLARSPDTPAIKNRAKTQCPQGHPYDEANTYVNRTGRRCCRACAREKAAARRLSDPAGVKAVRERYERRKRGES